MGLKNNFFQAMRELFGGESPQRSDETVVPEAGGFTQQADTRHIGSSDSAYRARAAAPVTPEYQFEDRMRTMLETSGLVGDDLQKKAQASSEMDSFFKRPENQPELEADTAAQERAELERAAQERAAESAARERAAQERAAQESAARERAAQERAAQERYSTPSFMREQPAPHQTEGGTQPRFGQAGGREGAEHELFPRSSSSAAEVTIISKNTLVTGNIRSFAGIYVEGNVNGNIEVVKNADINGKIIGNISCSDTRLNGALIQGDISSKGRVFMDKNAMIVGNMNGQSMDIDGKIKGDVDVGGRIGLRENSVVIGNINAGTISITDGANVQGYVNTTFLKENSEMVFPKQITLSEEEGAFSQRDRQN